MTTNAKSSRGKTASSTPNLVIVESPAKAKTIEKYLGKDFKVLSSVGHIRKDTKVDIDHDFAVTYEVDPDHAKVVSELKKAAKSAKTVWLATDEDREGESISWHLMEILDLPQDTKRITFHEITEPALKEAIQHPRTVDMDMVSSQQARQTLDMLVGYDLSGIIRKKVPGAISAGRVQSPALRLIVEREQEIERFQGQSTYKVTGEFTAQNTAKTAQEPFSATLDKNQPESLEDAKKLLESLQNAKYAVSSVDQSEGTKANPVPFATAALQIEANSRLGFSSSTTMRAAQALYQAGHITYHRTDSLNLSNQALGAIAKYIEHTFGKEYLQVRHFKTKSAGAQEAHEAIRPTHIEVETAGSNDYERKLYQLIRSRTLATQMKNAKVAKTTVIIEATGDGAAGEHAQPTGSASSNQSPATASARERSQVAPSLVASFIAKGEVVIFDGFLKVYGNAKNTELPPLKSGGSVTPQRIIAHQTFAKPPARYTEGSLVKKLEELGIGRPSTYASIMQAIQARGYVVKGDSDGTPRDAIELVLDYAGAAGALSGSIRSYDEEETTSPATAGARSGSRKGSPAPHISQTTVQEKSGATKGKLLPTPVGELVAGFLTDHFNQIVDYGFTAGIEQKLDQIADHQLDRAKMLRNFYQPFSETVRDCAKVDRYNSAIELGTDPKTKKPIYAKIGKNGGFIQLGDNENQSGERPRFAPLPDGKTVKTVTYAEALQQLALPELPRTLGATPDGTELIAASGPFGPYLKAGKYNIPIKGEDPYTITFSTAQALYQAKLDSIIADWGEIMIIVGAYGPYVKGPGRRNNVRIPKDQDPKKITLAQAEEMLKNKPKTRKHAPRVRKSRGKKG